jgi:hypothetical protein
MREIITFDWQIRLNVKTFHIVPFTFRTFSNVRLDCEMFSYLIGN